MAGRAGRGDVGGRAHLTGRTKSLRAWLPRPWQCLGHLQISSRRLAQHQRAAGGRWRLVAGRGGWWRDLKLNKVDSKLNGADILTKPPKDKNLFLELRHRLMGY